MRVSWVEIVFTKYLYAFILFLKFFVVFADCDDDGDGSCRFQIKINVCAHFLYAVIIINIQ